MNFSKRYVEELERENGRLRKDKAEMAAQWYEREDRLRRIEEAAKKLLLTTPGSRERWRKEMDLRAALAEEKA